ncbi:Hypothetical predicted protein [Paramuricea clavata]|uniref:Uncharacterized protein n=1 Tax=Paramuricea clavata TaxID=317549 RepID=A0A6S7LDR5_PARCT|nr:Hypothetical predicted protein [Paramuricea clavata]
MRIKITIKIRKLTKTFYLPDVISEETPRRQINKLAIPIGVSCGAVSLLVIVCLGLYFHTTRNDSALENDGQIEMQTMVAENEDAEDDRPEQPTPAVAPPAAAEFQIYTGEGTSSDLDMMKDRSSSALDLEELVT